MNKIKKNVKGNYATTNKKQTKKVKIFPLVWYTYRYTTYDYFL